MACEAVNRFMHVNSVYNPGTTNTSAARKLDVYQWARIRIPYVPKTLHKGFAKVGGPFRRLPQIGTEQD